MIALACLLAPSVAAAQGGDPRPVEPNTALEVSLDGGYERVGALDGGQAGLDLAGRVALDPRFEIGGGWGARASWASLDGGAGRARAGLPPLRAWIGTGHVSGAWRFGLRVEGGIGTQLLDAPEASSNGEHGYSTLVGEVGVVTDLYRPRLSLRVGAAYSGALAWAGVGELRLAIELGSASWPARPFAAARFFVSTDLGHSARPVVGAVVDVDASSLAIAVLGPGSATGQLVELQVTWRLPL